MQFITSSLHSIHHLWKKKKKVHKKEIYCVVFLLDLLNDVVKYISTIVNSQLVFSGKC